MSVILVVIWAGLPDPVRVPTQRSGHSLAAGHPASTGTRDAREQRSALTARTLW